MFTAQMEFSMRNHILFTTLGSAALVAGASLAQAQTADTIIVPQPGTTIIAQEPFATPPSGVLMAQPASPAPFETVETVKTVRTDPPRVVYHRAADGRVVHHRAASRVTTTRTTTFRQGVAPDVVAIPETPAIGAVAEPTYTEVINGPRYYDVAPGAAMRGVAQTTPGSQIPTYRYVYEPDRILVIDPYTNIAVQAIPR
jgi:hypothetical protein